MERGNPNRLRDSIAVLHGMGHNISHDKLIDLRAEKAKAQEYHPEPPPPKKKKKWTQWIWPEE